MPGETRLEVVAAGRATFVENLSEPTHIDDILFAERALRSAVAAGLFVPERTITYEHAVHLDSVAAWIDYLRDRWGWQEVSPALVARVRALAAAGRAAIVMTHTVSAARLRRV